MPQARRPALILLPLALGLALWALLTALAGPAQEDWGGLLAGEGERGGLRVWLHDNPSFRMEPQGGWVQAAWSLDSRRDAWFGAHESSLRAAGTLWVDRGGLHGLGLVCDDGARLYLDGRLAVDDWGPHTPELAQAWLELEPGPHPILIEYYNLGGTGCLEVYHSRPGETLRPGARTLDPARLSPAPALQDWPAWYDQARRARRLGAGAWLALGLGATASLVWALAGPLGWSWGRLAAWARRRWDLLAVMALALILRTLWLDRVTGLVCDEAYFGLGGYATWLGTWPGDWTRGMTPYTGPLQFFVLHPLIPFFAPAAWVLRLPTALLNVAGIGLAQDLLTRRLGRWTGLAAGLLLAAHPSLVAWQRFCAEVFTFNLLLAAAGAWLLLAREPRWWRSALGGLFLGLGVYNHLAFLAFPLALAAGTWVQWWPGFRGWLRQAAWALLGAAAPLAVLTANILGIPEMHKGTGLVRLLAEDPIWAWHHWPFFARALNGVESMLLFTGQDPWRPGPWLEVLVLGGGLGLWAWLWRGRLFSFLAWLGGGALAGFLAWAAGSAWGATLAVTLGAAGAAALAPGWREGRSLVVTTVAYILLSMLLTMQQGGYPHYHLPAVWLLLVCAAAFWTGPPLAGSLGPRRAGRGVALGLAGLCLVLVGVNYFQAFLATGGSARRGEFSALHQRSEPFYRDLTGYGCYRVRGNRPQRLSLSYHDLERNRIRVAGEVDKDFVAGECLVFNQGWQFFGRPRVQTLADMRHLGWCWQSLDRDRHFRVERVEACLPPGRPVP